MLPEQDTRRKEILRDFFGDPARLDQEGEWLENVLQFENLMMKYRATIRELTTKLEVLNDEFSVSAKRNPIETIQSRVKRPYSIAQKLRNKGLPVRVDMIRLHLNDVAGVRVICPFLDDIYTVAGLLLAQDDIRLVTRKDYIRHPKPNGYRSLHLIVEIPVFFSQGKEWMRAEVQIRTVAMDFWASLEHQIRYKQDLPDEQDLPAELLECANCIADVDQRVYLLRRRLQGRVPDAPDGWTEAADAPPPAPGRWSPPGKHALPNGE